MSQTRLKIKKQFEFYANDHSGELGRKLNRSRVERRFCDFLIKVGSEEIYVHRNVIAEASDFFRAMLAHEMRESDSGVAEMHDVDGYCMHICVEYMYTGNIFCSGSKVPQLLNVADMLQLTRLCAEISKFLQANLDSDVFYIIREIAATHNLQDLAKSCAEFAKVNFVAIAGNEDFLSLEEDCILELIRSEETKASETEKCKSLVFWASCDPGNRSETFEEAFLTLNLKELPKGYRLSLCQNEPLISESNACLRQLFKTEVGAVSLRGSRSGRDTVIGFIDKKSETIETFKPSDGSWNILHDLPEEIHRKSSFCTVAVDQVVFVIADDCTNYKFNLSNPDDGWTALPNRSVQGRVQVVELDGQFYAFHNQNQTSVKIEILNTDQTSWTQTRKSKPCYEEAITVAKGSIYTFGGLGESSYLQRSLAFDPRTNSWMNLPDMPTARYWAAATSLDDKIYVMGGDNKVILKTTECFDISTRSWTTLKPMNYPHFYLNAFTFDGKVYAVDNSSYGEPFAVEEYDPATNTWKNVIPASDKKISFKATFILHR